MNVSTKRCIYTPPICIEVSFYVESWDNKWSPSLHFLDLKNPMLDELQQPMPESPCFDFVCS